MLLSPLSDHLVGAASADGGDSEGKCLSHLQRPSDCCAAEQGNELAPFHIHPQHQGNVSPNSG